MIILYIIIIFIIMKWHAYVMYWMLININGNTQKENIRTESLGGHLCLSSPCHPMTPPRVRCSWARPHAPGTWADPAPDFLPRSWFSMSPFSFFLRLHTVTPVVSGTPFGQGHSSTPLGCTPLGDVHYPESNSRSPCLVPTWGSEPAAGFPLSPPLPSLPRTS